MATSDVLIANMALQKLGAARIVSFSDNSRNARSVNACYELLRNAELQANMWTFCKSRAALAASPTVPAFDFANAFPVPSDFLRVIFPPQIQLDWRLERQAGQRVILSNQAAPLNLPYIALVTDPMQFDPMFCIALACKIAWHCCEEITQSNTKKADVMNEYRDLIGQARMVNALETLPQDAPDDSWDAARIVGGPWLQNPNIFQGW